jgi:transcriptional regulator with XRE-family HTH domain
MSESFGELVRRHRAAAAVSMGELARRVNYSKSYLSKIENNLKPPNATLARLCDHALDADGALIAAAQVVRERTDSAVELGSLDRRQMLAGAGTLLGIALTGGPRPVPADGVVTGLRTSFEHLRVLGSQTSPTLVLEPLVAQVRTVQALARENQEPMRSRLLLLAGRIAEYVGWLSQEAGNEQGALWWTRYAADLARAGGDSDIVSYTLVREAGLALYRQDPAGTIDLAQQAQHGNVASLYVLGMAARREAQGHALAGDRDACERALDRAAELLESSTVDTRAYPVLGSTAPDPLALARGWALADLGRAGESAALLDRELSRLPVTNRRTRARFGVRRSLAYALSGEIDQSCLTLVETIDDAAHVDSATIRMDLRELSRSLSRWRGHRAVQEIYPRLSDVLRRHPAVL